jgi:fatty-acyl-CoA synthase
MCRAGGTGWDRLSGLRAKFDFWTDSRVRFGRVRKIAPDSRVLVCDDFEDAVDKFADHTAMLFEGERYTYRQLDALANRFAAWADAQGLKTGDTVAVLLPNRAEYISAWIGLTKLGIAAALINNNLTGAALAHCLSISNARSRHHRQ